MLIGFYGFQYPHRLLELVAALMKENTCATDRMGDANMASRKVTGLACRGKR